MIKRCVCQHRFQDKRYGDKMRVKNPVAKKQGFPQEYRCTVCGKVS
jgi:hypothetical protein